MEFASAELLQRFREGDQLAAEELFAQYVQRLTQLARSRLSPKLAQRLDPEDVVNSAYRSFFVVAKQGRFALKRSGDLWRLLVRMTLNKLYRSAAHHQAEMRSVKREYWPAESAAWEAEMLSREPAPDMAAALAEELELLMHELTPLGRRVLELRLQGETLEAIAEDVERSERTVRRVLESVRKRFTQRRGEVSDETC